MQDAQVRQLNRVAPERYEETSQREAGIPKFGIHQV